MGSASIAGSALSGEEPSSTILASGFGVMPKVRARLPMRSARRVALRRSLTIEQRKLSADIRRPLSGVAMRPLRAARLALDLDGDVDARAGVEGLGLVEGVARGVAEHEAGHQVVERVGAEDVAPRAGGGAVGDLALAHAALARARLGAEAGEVEAVAVVEVAEAEVAEALPVRIGVAGPMSMSMTPYSPQTRALAPSMRSAVFSSMPKPRRMPAAGHRHHQPAEAAALDEVLVDHAVGEEAEAVAEQQARALGVGGDAVHDRLDGGAAEDHRSATSSRRRRWSRPRGRRRRGRRGWRRGAGSRRPWAPARRGCWPGRRR